MANLGVYIKPILQKITNLALICSYSMSRLNGTVYLYDFEVKTF